MRPADFADWWRLRRFLVHPWAFLRARKKGFSGPHLDLELKDGGVFRVRNAPMDPHIFHRIFARDEYRLDGLPPGSFDTVIDIGAHIGCFAARAAALARRVLCYEPSDENHALLERNVSRFPNVTLRRQAVGPKRGELEFHISEIPSASSLYPTERHPVKRTIRVECVTLADVFLDHGVSEVDLLKIDVEGAEYEVVYGCPRELWPSIRRVYLEYDPVPGSPPEWTGEGLEAHLARMGFRVEREEARKRPGKGHLWAARPGVETGRGS